MSKQIPHDKDDQTSEYEKSRPWDGAQELIKVLHSGNLHLTFLCFNVFIQIVSELNFDICPIFFVFWRIPDTVYVVIEASCKQYSIQLICHSLRKNSKSFFGTFCRLTVAENQLFPKPQRHPRILWRFDYSAVQFITEFFNHRSIISETYRTQKLSILIKNVIDNTHSVIDNAKIEEITCGNLTYVLHNSSA